MDERDRLAECFEQQRGQMLAVAYRMLGSAGEAEDAVQEAWLRLSHQRAATIDNLPGWPDPVRDRDAARWLAGLTARALVTLRVRGLPRYPAVTQKTRRTSPSSEMCNRWFASLTKATRRLKGQRRKIPGHVWPESLPASGRMLLATVWRKSGRG